MTRSDARKRAEWQKRLVDFEASGLTVAQFCQRAGVGTHTFYYWKRRLGRKPVERRGDAARHPGRGNAREVPATARDGGDAGPQVAFTWGSALRISVPAHCVDAIRCVLECATLVGPAPGDSAGRFQEVVLAQ